MQSFFTIAAQCSDIFFPAFIACQTGLGRSEVLKLKWENIDFQEQQISVDKYVISNGQSVIKQKKIYMSNQLSELLYIEKGRRKQGVKNIEGDYICQTVTGSIMKPEYFDRRFRMFVTKNKNQIPKKLQFKDLVRMNHTIKLSEMLSDDDKSYGRFKIIPQCYIDDSRKKAA